MSERGQNDVQQTYSVTGNTGIIINTAFEHRIVEILMLLYNIFLLKDLWGQIWPQKCHNTAMRYVFVRLTLYKIDMTHEMIIKECIIVLFYFVCLSGPRIVRNVYFKRKWRQGKQRKPLIDLVSSIDKAGDI